MKLLHLADLHLGKRVNGFSLITEQQYILKEILQIVQWEKPDGVLIAGDVYDKSQPTVEAVELLDEFLTKLTAKQPVFMISGNHDSPERLGFGSRIMQQNGLYIAGAFTGTLVKIPWQDEYGVLNLFLLPFLKPAMVRPFFTEPIESYEQAVKAVLATRKIKREERNVLVAHQFVVQGTELPERSDSESIVVGGLDDIDVSLFAAFDYVALGHLHQAQRIGRDGVTYAGSPLKYSFSEALHQKSVTCVELGAKGELAVRRIPLVPRRDLRKIKGPLQELLQQERASEDYLHVTLTDETEIYDALGQLRVVYPNLMVLEFAKQEHVADLERTSSGVLGQKSPLDLFANFYQVQNKRELNEAQYQVLGKIFAQAGSEQE